MSIVSRIFLPAVFTVGLVIPGVANAALKGFSIALTDVTLAYDPIDKNLSATAAAFGGMPAFPLPGNGSYIDTLSGDYAVIDNVPPLDKTLHWREFYNITLNGRTLFQNSGLLGPVSLDDIWEAIIHVSKAPPALVTALVHVLETDSTFNSGGLFDYAYNFQPDDRMVGTFAVGSTKDLAALLGLPEDFPPGENELSITASLFAVPEPPTWLMLAAGLLVVGVIRSRARRFRSARSFS